MDKKSLDTLEFPKILERLAEHTVFSASRTMVRALRPTNDLTLAQNRLARTSEASRLLSEYADISVGGARDVRTQAELAARGGVLTPEELLSIKATLISGRDLFRFFEKLSLDLPYLIALSEHLAPPEGLIEAISRVLSDKGEVKDSASQTARAPATVVVQNTPCLKAVRLIIDESDIACLPSVVLTINWISSFFSISTICGLPSATLLTPATSSPASSITVAVPCVATIE